MDSSCEQGSQNSTCSQNEPELELLRHFVKAVDFQYGVQNSRLSEIESLMKKLIELRKTLIPRSYQNIFNEYVLKYLEICLEFLTHCGDATIMEQKKYSTLLLNFIPEFFQEPDLKNTFVKDATVKILDLFMYGPFNNLSKKSLLNLYNTIASQAHPQVLVEVSENILYYMYKLMDCLSTYGDYLMQSDIMKTLYRIFGSHIANKQLQYEFLPGSEQLSERLAMEISVDNFNADVRRWLNKFNNDSKLIFSMPCEALIFGSITCKCPNEGPDAIWVDFDLKDCVLSFYSLDSNGTNWNRIMIMANDVQKVEVTGQFKSSECTTISLQLSKPCISESPDNQEYWNSLDKHFKMIINGEQKAKINKLLVHILPPLFEDKFLRTSSRVPTKIKNVYKPLRMKTSKRKSTSSESSSKSKSDVNLEKYSVIQPEPPKHSVSQIEAAQSTVAEEKQSKLKPSSLLRSDVSVVISDFTNNSSRASVVTSDTLSIISVKSSAVFESRPSSADLVEGTPTLQEGVLGITESQVINVSRTHSIISIESSNDTENVNLITTCNQSKNQDEEHILSETSSMSGFIEKKTAKLLISESESDILEQSENRIGTEEISQASGLSDFIQKQVTKRIISESHTDIENVVEKHQESESEEIPIVEENDSTDSSISQNEDRKSIDPFDLLLADTAKPIKVKIISNMQKPNEDHFQKRTVGTKTRKLYNPGNLSYLDAMQVAEQSTSEIKTSPIHIKKGAKVHKQKKPRTKKPKEVSNTSKENSVRNKTKDSFKREIKKRKPSKYAG